MPGCIDATLCPMRADIFESFLDNVWHKVLDSLAVFSDYVFVGEMWVAVVVLTLAAGYVAVMVPWQWLRSALGFLVIVAITFVGGMQTMFNHMRREKSEHDKRQEFDNEVKRSNDNTKSWW